MTLTTWLVTGTSRGIGLEIVSQLVADPANIVIATCRNPAGATALSSLQDTAKGVLYILPLDVASEASIRASVSPVAAILGDRGLNYLYNNAAVTEGDDSAFDFSVDGFSQSLQVNVVAPALLGQLYLPFIEKNSRKVIVNITSGLASIGLDFGAKNATYSVSKTALNMLTYKQARARPDITSICIDPGWVKTDMGGPNAVTETHDSVSAVLRLVTSVSPKDSGKFFRHDGEIIVW